MGMFDFIKEAGEKLFGKGEAKAAQDAAVADPSTDKVDAANRAAGDAIEAYIAQMGLTATGLTVTVDGSQGKVAVFGVAADQATREKIILCCGNVEGVDSVEDKMSVNVESDESQWHTVVKGDTLWAISQAAYGNGAEYNKIFEANKPMLSNPDKIYPGQKLRIPPK
ncbi:MAG: peptidoglycan-binding protein LysM [Burkholderiaceae bacterium]|jgi:nucleoid-associated protein YgaU|uniref:Potassium binding protein Kbp n=1 Tax=Cupriavidus metallidurans TaxID=119219 RepID=A0A482IIC1_9BURK|nr:MULTISPECIES: peptidoglycan-binding protein LysM [Cupriavidus]KWR82914.1 peptidase M23 [Cupriavidus sp. SHE]PCH55413.1 MAG: peptidoglycan-binding protein LysM [Burkholderiaceae bacterium]QBP09085.1 peptidoglycan-binding protein LysM [Cupriavidus metallidurans]QWC89515.1 peptidoglycan-binding protein LysM [Cupriavidus metallidurans]